MLSKHVLHVESEDNNNVNRHWKEIFLYFLHNSIITITIKKKKIK